MVARLAVWLMGVLLAGCLATGPGEPAPPEPEDEPTAPRAYPIPASGWETTTLHGRADGRMIGAFEAAVAPLPGGGGVVADMNGVWTFDGTAWQTNIKRDCTVPLACQSQSIAPSGYVHHGDAAVAVTPDGTIHHMALPAMYQRSDDGGTTWNQTADWAPGADRPWIQASGQELLAWWGLNGVHGRASHDGGQTWNATGVIGPCCGFGGAAFWQGAWHVPISTRADLRVVSVEDPGNATIVVQGDVRFPAAAMAPGGDGALWLASAIGEGADRAQQPNLGLWRMEEAGTWQRVDGVAEGVTAALPWVAPASGGVVATWVEQAQGLPVGAPAPWHLMAAYVAGDTVRSGRIAEEPIHVGSVCREGISCVGGGDRTLLDYIQTTTLDDGRILVAYPQTVEVGSAEVHLRAAVGFP